MVDWVPLERWKSLDKYSTNIKNPIIIAQSGLNHTGIIQKKKNNNSGLHISKTEYYWFCLA